MDHPSDYGKNDFRDDFMVMGCDGSHLLIASTASFSITVHGELQNLGSVACLRKIGLNKSSPPTWNLRCDSSGTQRGKMPLAAFTFAYNFKDSGCLSSNWNNITWFHLSYVPQL